jgi:hypothetical protein
VKKKIWANLQRGIELFTQKIILRLSKIWTWDLRSRIRKNLSRIPDPGVKKAPDPGSAPTDSSTYSLLFRAHFKQQQHERADMISMTKVEKEKSVTKAAKAVEALHRQAAAYFRINFAESGSFLRNPDQNSTLS